MDVREVPEGLADLPPGPGLAAVLHALDLGRVPNDRMLEVLAAQYRQLAHEQARTAATIAELGRCADVVASGTVDRLDAPHPWGPEETRAALRWTSNAAYAEHELSEAVVHGMPEVFTAWEAGEIDRPRVRVFHRYLDGLADDVTARVCAVAVPRAPGLTTGQLTVLLRRLVIAADPEAADRWYRKGLRERGVSAYLAADGTVSLTGHGLAVDEAEAACVRIQDLAAAAQRAGHPGRIGQIRADVYLGLLDGRFHGMTADGIIHALLAAAAEAASESAEPAIRDDRRGIEIRVALSTLLGRDEQPAEVPGLGLLVAAAARMRVGQQQRAQWRFAVIDHDGHLLTEGVTRRRPSSTRGTPGPRGGIVELHVPDDLLRELAADPGVCGEWAGVVADIAAQHARRDQRLQDLDAHPRDRLPRPPLRRHTEIRDRTCTHPSCRRPARACDQDHTREHARGGRTVRSNLGPACPRDHKLRHEGGWEIEQPEPGRFVWHSPLGGRYTSRGEFWPSTTSAATEAGRSATEENTTDPTAGCRFDDGPILRRPADRAVSRRGPPPDPTEPPPF